MTVIGEPTAPVQARSVSIFGRAGSGPSRPVSCMSPQSSALKSQVHVMTGRDVHGPIQFRPQLDPRSGLGAQWRRLAVLLGESVARADAADPTWHLMIAARLADAAMAALLVACDNQYSDLLWHDVRLERAHQALREGSPELVSATAVAAEWGFLNYGRFTATYRQRYGRPPPRPPATASQVASRKASARLTSHRCGQIGRVPGPAGSEGRAHAARAGRSVQRCVRARPTIADLHLVTGRHAAEWRSGMKLSRAYRSIACVMGGMVLVVASGLTASADPAVPSPPTTGCTQPGAGLIGGTFIDPYSVYGASRARLDAMFANMKAMGMDTAVVQWTGYQQSATSSSTTYDGSFDSSLDSLITSARAAGMRLWLGLVVHPEVLDDPATNTDQDALNALADLSVDDAHRLQQRYAGDLGTTIVGWYIPTEPGLQSVNDAARRAMHVGFFQRITTGLKRLDPALPILGSPATARASEQNQTGVWFMDNFEPFFADSGVDVWALQDGFEMTSWTAQDNAALIERGRDLAAKYGVGVWADLYTPGPRQHNETSIDTSAPYDPWSLEADLDAIRATGVPIVSYTFDDAMNTAHPDDPNDPTDVQQRQRLANAYWNYCTGGDFTR